jgi:4-hydroxybenzoate polyprenyltransferase
MVLKNKFTDTLVYANIFISFAGLSQVILTLTLFSIPINWQNVSYVLFVFLSTFLQYNMQRGYNFLKKHPDNERNIWLFKNKKVLLIFLGISLISLLFLCNWLSWTSIGIMIAAELISSFYFMKPLQLRRFGFVKPFIISLIWVVSCAIVPFIENNIINSTTILFCSAQFFFIAALCVLFDIKDKKNDLDEGIKTYANTYGTKITKLIAFILTVFYFIIMLLVFNTSSYILLNSLYFLIVTIAILITNDEKDSFYYFLFVDGLLIIQLLITAGCLNLFGT